MPLTSRGFHPKTPTAVDLDVIACSLAHWVPQPRGARRPQRASSAANNRLSGTKRASKLARDNNVSAEEEAEIKEAFGLFVVKHPGFSAGKEDVIPVADVRRALMWVHRHESASTEEEVHLLIDSRALSLSPANAAEMRGIVASLDPTETGFATYATFFAVCALKLHARTTTPAAVVEVIDTAFRLFTNGDEEEVITMAHLKRIARELKEDVSDEVLRDMILEANGGAGVGKGVEREEFEGVMRRAGVF